MNLVVALKTGKPLRRPVERHTMATRTGYLGNDYVLQLLTGDKEALRWAPRNILMETDVLADDWEVKE